MRPFSTILMPALLLVLLGAALPTSTRAAQPASTLSLEQWRAERIAALTADSGFLTPVGLFWLEPGRNSFGRARTNRLVLDHPAMPRRLGDLVLDDGQVLRRSARRACSTPCGG